MTAENYLQAMKESTRQTLAEPRVKEFMKGILKAGAEFPIDHIIGDLEESMREYAQNWSVVAAKHEASGLYRKIANFALASSQSRGVYVDIGCGAGNLLCAMPQQSKLIGIDINPYLLQIAEQNLRKAGRKVERHSKVRMGFLPYAGLVVRPEPILQELDLEKVQLISDDNRDFGNTIRTLYNKGIRADAAFFTLAGGHSVQRSGEIISMLKYQATGKDEGEVKSMEDILNPILNNIPFIVRPNGRIYIAMRGIEVNDQMQFRAASLRDHFDKHYKNRLEVVREESIPILEETKENGIQITHRLQGGEEVPQEVHEKMKELPYLLNLCEVKVK